MKHFYGTVIYIYKKHLSLKAGKDIGCFVCLVVVGGCYVPFFAVSLVSGKPMCAGTLEIRDTIITIYHSIKK